MLCEIILTALWMHTSIISDGAGEGDALSVTLRDGGPRKPVRMSELSRS
jgi:hypothetical protein